MQASGFYNLITRGGGDVVEALLGLLDKAGIRYCVIGGQAVNYYAEPLVSLDLDLVVTVDRLADAEELLAKHFSVQRFPHSLNIVPEESDLRVQIQTDPRYSSFVERARPGNVLGTWMSVASMRDVLQSKVWAAQDPLHRPSKRQKDLADIARLVEVEPEIRDQVPPEILQRIE